MPAPKGNQNAKGNPGGSGRPTSYRPEHVKMVRLMAAQGWTEIKMSAEIGIDPDTFRRWKAKYVDFLRAATPTEAEKISAVQNSLFHRAIGYDVVSKKIVVVNGAVVEVPIVEHHPPETAAIKYYLNNRARAEWNDKQEIESSNEHVVRVVGGLPDDEPKEG